MATLHLFTAGLAAATRLDTLLAALSADDCVLLLDDGVLWAAHPRWDAGCAAPVYVLADQARARGATLQSGIQAIDTAQWLALACQHERCLTW